MKKDTQETIDKADLAEQRAWESLLKLAIRAINLASVEIERLKKGI